MLRGSRPSATRRVIDFLPEQNVALKAPGQRRSAFGRRWVISSMQRVFSSGLEKHADFASRGRSQDLLGCSLTRILHNRRIENTKGYVLIAVYLFIYLYACYSHNSKY
ncbi:hypothetical protein EYF80_061914 [Liparis tanakae]|uniref:Uncharacterized protein n=1 Tax=Liparis tanakae TaxID=230148 RepID=A0A4Z2EGC1_9TELE|nr:hypothetical protein EYF80_061914 [Liparis tanakae]